MGFFLSVSAAVVPRTRRVLPEHEGKYKVSLPKGSTKKSREILAKHSAMQSDKTEKKSIFERLNSKHVEIADSTSNESQTKMPSIFNRLGSYKELEKKVDRHSIAFSGILKGSQKMVRSPLELKTELRICFPFSHLRASLRTESNNGSFQNLPYLM